MNESGVGRPARPNQGRPLRDSRRRTPEKPRIEKVNINTASAEQLTTLPGVGPELAARILEYRQKSGAFKSVAELMNVKDIDPYS